MKLSKAEHLLSVPDNFHLKEVIGESYYFFTDGAGHGIALDFYSSGELRGRRYSYHLETHRDWKDGPAHIAYYPDGQLLLIAFCLHGRFHRPAEDGPAITRYFCSGKISTEEYRLHGKYHRPIELGPAYIQLDGDKKNIEYYEHGALKSVPALNKGR